MRDEFRHVFAVCWRQGAWDAVLCALAGGAAVVCGATAATHPVRILAALGVRGSGWEVLSGGDRRGVWVHALHAEPRVRWPDLGNGSRHGAKPVTSRSASPWTRRRSCRRLGVMLSRGDRWMRRVRVKATVRAHAAEWG